MGVVTGISTGAVTAGGGGGVTAATAVSGAAGCASATMTGDGAAAGAASRGGTGNVPHGTVIAGQPRSGPRVDHHVGRDLHITPAATPIDGFVGRLLRGVLHQLFRRLFSRVSAAFSTGFSAGFSACAAMREGDSAGGGAGVGGAVSSMALGAAAERSSPRTRPVGKLRPSRLAASIRASTAFQASRPAPPSALRRRGHWWDVYRRRRCHRRPAPCIRLPPWHPACRKQQR